MAQFQEGNKFWQFRSKHGRDKLFETPKLMWEAACEYFEWCDENPFYEVDFRGKDLERVELPKIRPYTLEGLCFYLNASSAYFRAFKSQERANKADFITVIAEIEETIANQQFSGAASGFLNANIIARKLGLKDQSDVTTAGKPINSDGIDYEKLTNEQLAFIESLPIKGKD